MLALALAAALGLGVVLRRDKGALQFMGAALLLAVAGYSWQGRPEQPGAPKARGARVPMPETAFAQTREETFGRFNRARVLAEHGGSRQRVGDHLGAAGLLAERGRRAIHATWRCWLGFGNALVLHGGGMMSPAAQLAFQRVGRSRPTIRRRCSSTPRRWRRAGITTRPSGIWRELAATARPARRRSGHGSTRICG